MKTQHLPRITLAAGTLFVTGYFWEPAAGQTAYVTGAPIPAWLVQRRLENVHLALQVVDPILGLQEDGCEVVGRRHMSDVPCARNPDRVCDVAFS